MQTRVDVSGSDHWHLQEIESDEQPGPGTDVALLAGGHPTLTALTSVGENPEVDVPGRIGVP